MRKLWLRFTALMLIFCLLLSGCHLPLDSFFDNDSLKTDLTLETLEYTRPLQADLQEPLEACKLLAQEGVSMNALVDAILVFYDAYDQFLTNCSIANLRYYADVTDSYWREESTYCTNNLHLADAALEELYYALAKSPLLPELESEDNFGANFFDAYQGDATGIDPQLLALYEKEAAVLNEYYDLIADFDGDYYSSDFKTRWQPQFAALYARLIGIRQEISAFCGYPSYADYAYDIDFRRDYTPAQAEAFMESLQTALYDIYTGIDTSTILTTTPTQAEVFQYGKTAAQAMGGDIAEAFRFLEENKLYDIAPGANKYDISYEIFLWSYDIPVLFIKPYQDQTDFLTFVHEFGHYVNDYVCSGSAAGIDVAEIHSQAMEYLSLFYADASEALVRYKLYDSLCDYMETSAYSLFEHEAYKLTGNDLTGENLIRLADDIARQFGFHSWGIDGRDFVTVGHFYTYPMYMISYVVSNDLALQFYQLEQEQTGKGLALYEECIYSQDSQIVAFAERYQLESPFSPGRAEKVAKTFEDTLK